MKEEINSSRVGATIEVEGLNVQFLDQLIIHDLSFSIQEKEFVCILGPSGCGKSTLLRLLGGLLSYQSGRISIDGQPPAFSWQSMSYVFQSPRLVSWRNAVDNVMLGAELRIGHPSGPAVRAQAMALLSLLGLSQDTAKYPAMLSGGERQRVAIARALIVDPKIILMDEPFSALDMNTRARLRAEIVSVWSRTGKTVVFVTHDVEEAIVLADRIIVLTGKPTRVLRTVTINHSRPRDLRGDADLTQIRCDLEDTMRELQAHIVDVN